ncbi:MAG: ABC transporter ATP-binding protein [Thermoleophilia bacterium]
MSEPLLSLRGVSRTFVREQRMWRRDETIYAVRQVDLDVAAGETVALVGESGAGKSTIALMVLGIESPDEGRIVFDGADITALHGRARRRVRQRMHLILQDPYQSLHPGMRVDEAVGEPLAIGGVPRAERGERIARALRNVGLAPPEEFMRRHPHELSGGQRQRVAMARAFVCRPRLVIADEPTSMLDATLRGEILGLMARMRDELETTFVLITHDLASARLLADRVAVMRGGAIIEQGPTQRVLSSPAHEYTRVLLAASEGRLIEGDR